MGKPERLYYDLDGAVEYLNSANVKCSADDLMHFGEINVIDFIRLLINSEFIEAVPNNLHYSDNEQNRRALFTHFICDGWAVPISFDRMKKINRIGWCDNESLVLRYYILDARGIYEQQIDKLQVPIRISKELGDCYFSYGHILSLHDNKASNFRIEIKDLYILTSELDRFIKVQTQTPETQEPKELTTRERGTYQKIIKSLLHELKEKGVNEAAFASIITTNSELLGAPVPQSTAYKKLNELKK